MAAPHASGVTQQTAVRQFPALQFAALADDTRWSILELLGSEPRSASELARELPVSRQAIAKHLALLEEAGLVDAVREGRSVRHRAIGASLSALADRLDAWRESPVTTLLVPGTNLDTLRATAELVLG